jgi:hypothetical protein
MTGFSEMPGQDPGRPSSDPDRLGGFEAEPLPPRAADDPGRTLGIVGFVLAILFNIVGVIVSIIAYNQSKRAGYQNGFAVAGIVVGSILFVLGGALSLLLIGTGAALLQTGS